MISNAYRSPLVQKIVLEAILKMKEKEYVPSGNIKINSDLIPKFSEDTVKGQNFLPSMINSLESSKKTIILKPKQHLLLPRKVYVNETPIQLEKHEPKVQPFPSLKNVQLEELYNGKLRGLINDSSVASIECLGPNTELNIFRAGQKMRTKIILSKEDIERILEEISDKAMIPLTEGVFRVIVNNLMINAVISEVVGTKFMIKKMFQINDIKRNYGKRDNF